MNKISKLFQIKYPIIQAGMVWASGWRLASAVSNAGGLGLIGAGSMHPAVLRNHIKKFKKVSNKPFGVNIPLFYPQLDEIISIIIEEKDFDSKILLSKINNLINDDSKLSNMSIASKKLGNKDATKIIVDLIAKGNYLV